MNDDEHIFEIPQVDAPTLKVYGAPRPENRSREGLRQLMLLVRIDRPTHGVSWDDLREVALAHKIILDPRDVHHPEDYDGGWNADRWAPTGTRDHGLVP